MEKLRLLVGMVLFLFALPAFAADVLNRMLELGRPEYVRIA